MLLYVFSPNFPGRTFIVMVNSNDNIARIRAQLLHHLYEIGHEDYHFKLQYRDLYVRDSCKVKDYNISSNDVLAMVPISNSPNSKEHTNFDTCSLSGIKLENKNEISNIYNLIKKAMDDEIKTFDRRENLIDIFKVFTWLQLIMSFVGFFTTFWYCGFWYIMCFYFAYTKCPNYCRQTGFTGSWAILKIYFCVVFLILTSVLLFADVLMIYFSLRNIVMYGCSTLDYESYCNRVSVFSSAFYLANTLLLLVQSALCSAMLHNFKIEIGDYMEKYLIASRDIVKVLESARNGGYRERRLAAFELATLAASGDDNKFRICMEGGLPVLIRLLVSGDMDIAEQALEAIAELLTVPVIQNSFVQNNGVVSLLTVLRTSEPRLTQDAAAVLCYLVTDSIDHQTTVASSQGLSDICYAAQNGSITAQKTLAAVLLQLVFNREICHRMLSSTLCLETLTKLSESTDLETAGFALQTLEIMALEDDSFMLYNADFLSLLLGTPWRTMNSKLLLIAGKLLLYFVEDPQHISALIQNKALAVSLERFGRIADATLQKVVVKIVFCLYECPISRKSARQLRLDNLLNRIRNNAIDPETVEMAEQGLRLAFADDALLALPSVNTLDKMLYSEVNAKLETFRTEMGSKASLHSPNASTTSLKNKKMK